MRLPGWQSICQWGPLLGGKFRRLVPGCLPVQAFLLSRASLTRPAVKQQPANLAQAQCIQFKGSSQTQRVSFDLKALNDNSDFCINYFVHIAYSTSPAYKSTLFWQNVPLIKCWRIRKIWKSVQSSASQGCDPLLYSTENMNKGPFQEYFVNKMRLRKIASWWVYCVLFSLRLHIR